MPIDYAALDRALGGNTQEPILGTTEIDPQTGLTLSEKDIDAIRSRMKYGSPLEVFPGPVPKSTLRILGDQGYYPQHGDEYTRRQLAREQSSFGQFVNAMNQAVIGEIIGGTMEGAGYMLDLKQYGDLISGEEEDFGNVLSNVGKALKTWTREVGPVHTAPGAKEFDPGNWAWWMSNFPSVASTLSLMIPSAGVVRGMGALGKLIGVAGKMGQKAKWMTTGISQAVVSRHMENLMEASGVYEERYDYGKNMDMTESEAKKFASIAASNTYSKQWAMLLQDIPQYLLLNKLGGIGKNVRSSKLAAAMGMAPGKYYGAKTVSILRDMAGEAGEEAYQYLINEQSKLMAMKSVDPKINTSLGRVWQDHYDSGEMKTAALFGALGAGVMQVGFAGFNAKAIQVSNKVRIQELTNRSRIFETAYKEYQDALDSNNPIQQRQALANLEIALATAAEAVGNEKHLIDDIKRMTNDPNDEIFERYGIDAEQGTILKDNPEIANRMMNTVKRVRQLRNTFGRENSQNRKIKKEDQGKFTQLMIYNQLMLERAKEEQKTLQQELDSIYGNTEKFNELSSQGQIVKRLQHQISAISDPTGKQDVSGEDKIGTLDALRKRLVEREDQLSEEEKAILEFNIKVQESLLNINKGQLEEAEKLYTKEDRTKDEGVAIVDEELNQLLSHQRRVRWADATVEDLEGSLKLLKEGKILGEIDEDVEDASTDKYDPDSDIKVDSFVEYTDEEGNVQRGRVTALKLAETDSEGIPAGREGETVDNVYTVQPVNEKGEPIGEIIEGMSGADLTLSKEQESYDETDDTIDIIDQDVATDDVAFTRKNPRNRGTITPVTHLSYSEDRNGKVVSRDEELYKVLSDPNTSYTESEAEYYFTSDNTYLQTLKANLNKRIKELSDKQKKTDSEKKELTALRKINPLFNKLMKGEFLTQKEAETFVSANKSLPIGSVVDTIPISINVTIEGTKYGEKGGLYLHSAGFPYIKIPPSVINKMRKDPEARNVYLNQKVAEARTIRNSILLHALIGQRLYTTDLKVGRGVPNSLPTNISKDKRKKNIAQALNVPANKIRFGITKSLPHQPYYATMWVGENSRLEGDARYNTAGNLFILTTNTINGKLYSLKANASKIIIEHADIILDAFQNIGFQEHKRRKEAFAKYKDDSKIAKDLRYKFSWKKGYERVTGISPAELLDLLIAHGRNLTDPRASKRKRDISDRHKRELLKKTLYLEATKNVAILHYGFNPETEEPYQINLADLRDIDNKRIHFAEWVVENKNYAAHIHKRGNEETGKVNIELNGGLLNNRPFTIGERKETQIVRKKGEGYNEFLINNMLYTIDAEQNELSGNLFKDPTLNLNIQRDGDKLNLRTTVTPVQKQASEKVASEQSQPKVEAEKLETQKQEEKKPLIKTKEQYEDTIAKFEAERDKLLEKITDPKERKKIQSKYKYRIDKVKKLRKVAEAEKKEPIKPNPLDDVDRGFDFAMEAKEEVPQKKMNFEKELAWVAEKVGLTNVETVSRILRIASTGRRAWALYSHDTILLDEAAVEGVLYHEAFHRVSLGYLTKSERESLYRTARQVYKMENATDKEVEERLADEFREFVLLQDTEDKPTQPKGIRGVFQRIYNWIKSVFTGPFRLRENDIDRMFKQIYAGKYANNEVLEANLNNIIPGEFAMIVGGKQFNTITSSKQRKDVVKMLARMALEVNGIRDLNAIRNKNKIKVKPFYDWLNESIKNFETYKQDTPERQARADQMKAVYKEVQANKIIFWDMVLDYFADIGIKSKNARLSELDIYQLEQNQEVVGEIDYDKRSSYEISIKDNALSSVRFLVDSLHMSATVDLTTGLQPTVSGNEVWSSLLLHLNAFEDIQDMITELKVLATDNLDMPWYRELASKLENGSDNLRNQFLRTFNVWKHDFITFKFFGTRQGVKWNLFSNSQSELARNLTLSWNERLYLDEKLVSTSISGRRKPHADTFIELEESFQELVSLVDENVIEGNIDNKRTQEHIKTLVNLLNKIHIEVDAKTINYLLNEFYEDSLTMERLYTMLTNDMLQVLGRTSPLYEEAVRTETEEDEGIEPVLGMFMRIPMLFTSERSLSRGYAMAHPELQENVVLGAEGNKYFTYAENNMATDIVHKLKKDDDYLATRRSLLNNKHSRVLKYLSEDINIREAFYLKTFSALTGRDRGRNYKQVTPLEEYLIRFNALENDLMPVAIMANRKQHYYISGIPLLKDVTKTINVVNNRIELEYSDETLDLFYGYFLDEKERVIYAREVRDEYHNEETPKERKDEIYQTLVKNYHYEGDIDLNKGNAYHFQHFKEFNKYKTAKQLDKLSKKEVKGVITGILNDLFEKEYRYAAKIGAISKVGLDLTFDALFSAKGSELDRVSEEDTHQRDAVVQVLADMMINNMMSTIESEKVLFADPAFFAKNKDSEFDVSEDMYKRWFGVGSTGARLAKNTEMHPDTTFNVATFNTQKFKSKHYEVIHARHKKLYQEAGLTEEEAEKRATDVLDALIKVDPTDGTMLISPAMFRSISDRLGQWSDEKDAAYEMLMSDKKLSPKEELKAAGIVLQPLKTVYIGKQAFNNLDLVIYDKMSMVTLFRRQVKNTPLEDVLNRMEAVGYYKGLEEVHAFKYDSATKLGGRPGIDFFTDKNNRNKVMDLSDAVIHRQLFDNLKHQVVTDVHDVERQLVGSQAYKVVSSNIQKEQEYGEYGNGQQILDDMTASREAISTIGVDRVKARLGIRGTRIDDRRFIAMLSNDAKQAKKSFDFINALRIDDNTGEPYLELDSFMDRQWVYSRIMSIIGKETVNLEMPGNQLIQVSDYGASYDMDLGYSIPDEAGAPLEMEVRVSTALFKHVIPNYGKLTHDQRVKFLKEEFKLIGYRVPVQGQNSTVRLKVVDFLREQVGDVIQLPLEFTALTGSDFDIDKLFVMSYNYDKSARYANRVEKVKFSEGISQNAIDTRYEQKVMELFQIYRRNPEIIGEDITELLVEYQRVIGELKNHRTETYVELEAAQEVAKFIKEQLAKDPNNKELQNELLSTEGYIVSLEEDGRDWEWDIQGLKDAGLVSKAGVLIEAGVLLDKEAFAELPIEQQNTREANENRMLDIFNAVLGDPKHFLQTSTPLGAVTERLKAKASVVSKAYGEQKELLSLETTTSYFQSSIRDIFIGADAGIGAFALNNAHHSLTQHADFGIKSSLKFGFRDEVQDVIWFNKIDSQDDITIMDWLSAMIDAHVDAVKDPYIMRLNVNNATLNVVSTMLRIGIGENTFDFMSQPIIREYAQEFTNATGRITRDEITEEARRKAHEFAITKVKERWAEYMGIEPGDFENITTLDTVLKKIPLETAIKHAQDWNTWSKDKQVKYITRQLSILEHFGEIHSVSKQLNRVVMASRIDTKKYGSNPIQIKHFLNSILSLERSNQFIHLDRLINSEGEKVEGGTMLPVLFKNSALLGLNIMADKSIYGAYGFGILVGNILDSMMSGYNADENTIRDVMQETFSVLASDFFADVEEGMGVDKGVLAKMLSSKNKNNLFEQLRNIRKESHPFYKDLKDNKFLNMITVDYNPDFFFKWYLRTPFHTFDDRWETDDYIEDFRTLSQHESADVRQLAAMLYIYSFYTTGWWQRRHSIHGYLPTSMNKELQLKDGRVVSFNDFIKKLRRNLTDQEWAFAKANDVKRNVLKNNWYNSRLVPSLGLGSGMFEEVVVGDQTIGYILDTSDESEKSEYYLGRNKDNQPVYIPYITIASDDETFSTLIEYVGYNARTKKPIYRTVPRKGYNEIGIGFKEYGLTEDKSLFDKNNIPFYTEEQFKEVLDSDPDTQYVPTVSQNVVKYSGAQDAFYKDFTRMESEYEIDGIKVERMDFEDGTGGRTMRSEFKGKSTMDLVLDGHRIATSRTYILDVKEGDQVLFEDRFGRRALVEVTKAPYKVSEITPEEWSAMEGWDKSVYKSNLYQYQFKLLAGTSTADALTSYDRPLKIFTDGSSVQDKQILGYGAYFVFANEEYKMSGNTIDVNKILNNYKEGFTIKDLLKISKNPSPTMELMGILETLRKFSNTSEHLYILTDQENNVNYEGIWEHTFVNEHIPSAKEKVNGKRTKSTKPNTTGSSPWLEYLVPEIVKQIEKIEANGGSVRFQWIPGHINDVAVNKHPHAFADKEGATSRDIVDQYQKGNDNADILAKSTGRESNLKKLHAPRRESIEMLRAKAEEKYQDRSANGNEIC